MALYAPIDCRFPNDPKVIEAGYLAELVYLRIVLDCRESLTDGVASRVKWPRICYGVPRYRLAIETLVRVGLLSMHPEGVCIPPEVWERWNPTKAQVQDKRDEETERKRRYREEQRAKSR